jgi:hypothetical protein
MTDPSACAGFDTRGVVLIASDLTLPMWPERAATAGLNTIALHAADRVDDLAAFMGGETGQQFLAGCRREGLRVEYALHALSDLLPRGLYDRDPTLFRVDENARRSPDFNCCPSSPHALEIIAERAVTYARLFTPSTHRYFYWPDDGRAWCHCEQCRGFNNSEQALLVENAMLRAVWQIDPHATLSHLAYGPTLQPPAQITPDAGIFLEFAPIGRAYDRPFAEQSDTALAERLDVLDANLAVFPRHTAQALEYWLDVSRFSRWRRPAVKLPWRPDVLRADLAAYAQRGIRHVTTFSCYLDADYARLHGEPWSEVAEYGAALRASPIHRFTRAASAGASSTAGHCPGARPLGSPAAPTA